MDNLHDLFEHELQDVYDAEIKLVQALQTLASEARDDELREAFRAHLQETRGHVQRLENVFDIWGREPSRGEGCKGIDGIIEEKRALDRKGKLGEPVRDIFNAGAAIKSERYEISAYESLIGLARALQLDDVVDLLQKNLGEEEAALEKVQDVLEGTLMGGIATQGPMRTTR
jgi:ferritin-like metal-binding protein YciE